MILAMFIIYSLDHIHWTLSSADNSAITDDTSYWQGHIVGSGVVLDSKVLSLQGGGHVILGRFNNTCPGNPSLCEDGYSVSFWMKQGGRWGAYLAAERRREQVKPARRKHNWLIGLYENSPITLVLQKV